MSEKHADTRERFRVALLALRGRERLEIAVLLGIAKSTVETRANAYSDHGIDALRGKPRRGDVPKICGEHAPLPKERIDAGPREGDGVCTLRGKDLQRIAREELGVAAGISSVYHSLERLGYWPPAPETIALHPTVAAAGPTSAALRSGLPRWTTVLGFS